MKTRKTFNFPDCETSRSKEHSVILVVCLLTLISWREKSKWNMKITKTRRKTFFMLLVSSLIWKYWCQLQVTGSPTPAPTGSFHSSCCCCISTLLFISPFSSSAHLYVSVWIVVHQLVWYRIHVNLFRNLMFIWPCILHRLHYLVQ